jgi:NADPH2:quinone reductase
MTRAVVMRAFGGPEVLHVEEVELPRLARSDIRTRMEAAAINHSDLEIRRGAWAIRRPDPFPCRSCLSGRPSDGGPCRRLGRVRRALVPRVVHHAVCEP